MSANPLALAKRLREHPKGNVLLYGPPGTGKTAFAHFVARQLDRSVLVKRASDLISKWVGETEKCIRAMFVEAASDNAVLLLDEADSFLQDRRLAHRQWEITEVNELLTRMEGFEGVFICATNFIEQLDPAAMRRFAVKVRFDPLRGEQVHALFADMLSALKIGPLPEHEQQRLSRELNSLSGLTPGDFNAARKALDLGAYPATVQGFLDALGEELACKPGLLKRRIGFAA